jgi:hypothetical protein
MVHRERWGDQSSLNILNFDQLNSTVFCRGDTMSKRTWLIALAALMALAVGLRLWGTILAPVMRHPDKIFMVVFPLEFFSGDLNPHRFYYPTLHFYQLGLVYCVCFVLQNIFGAGWSRVEFAAYYIFWDSDALLVWARRLAWPLLRARWLLSGYWRGACTVPV